MTDYRMVARHVRYWRGAVHKWSTVWPFTGTLASGDFNTAIAAMKVLEQDVNYGQASAANGGLWAIALYDQAVGGVPVAYQSYFDPTTPGSWVAYTQAGWGATSVSVESNAEVALDVRWRAGLSSSGKPVYFRKWFHSVPTASVTGGTAQVSSANITLLQNKMQAQIAVIGGLGALLGRGGRLAAVAPVVSPFYGNHQMPRGRREKVSASKAKEQADYSAILAIINGESRD